MRVLPGRPVEVVSSTVKRLCLRRNLWSWRVRLVLSCGHELLVDHRFRVESTRYADGSMVWKRASRLTETKKVPCPACGPA